MIKERWPLCVKRSEVVCWFIPVGSCCLRVCVGMAKLLKRISSSFQHAFGFMRRLAFSSPRVSQKLFQRLKIDTVTVCYLPLFENLNKEPGPLVRWPENERTTLSGQQVLADICHIIDQGALAPATAMYWRLECVYDQGHTRRKLLMYGLMHDLIEIL
jgi:hypothetical protein